jgi:hypothetical protein
MTATSHYTTTAARRRERNISILADLDCRQ